MGKDMKHTHERMTSCNGSCTPRPRKPWLLIVTLLLLPSIIGWVQAVGAEEPFLKLHPLAPKEAYQEKINLVLLHGWNVNGNERIGIWNSLVKAIAHDEELRHIYRPYCVVYDHARPVADNGKRLGDLLQGKVVANSHLPAVLIGHSTGGLVARVFLQRFDPRESVEPKQYEPLQEPRILKLITLATPHHGTPFAVVDWLRNCSRLDQSRWLIQEILKKGRIPAETEGGNCLAWDNCDGKIPVEVQNIIKDKRGSLPDLFQFTYLLNKDLAGWLATEANSDFCSNWILYGGYHTWEPLLGVPKSLLNAWRESSAFYHPFTRAVMMDGYHATDQRRCRYPGDGIVPLESALLLRFDSKIHKRDTGEFIPGITVRRAAKNEKDGFMVDVDSSRFQKFDANMDLRLVRDVYHTYMREKPVVLYRVLEDLRTVAQDWEREQTPVPTESTEPAP